jgi:hypothetical protein
MKTAIWILVFFLLGLTACKDHGPLQGVWKDANETLLPCVLLQGGVDTLDTDGLFQAGVRVDSIQAPGFEVFPIQNRPGVYQLIQKKTQRNIHPIRLWKEGKNVTLMGIHQQSLDTLTKKKLIARGMLNNRLLIGCSGRPTELYVLWQNAPLPRSFLVYTKEGFATLIPKEAKSEEHSELRIFAVNDSLIVFDSRVKLLYGKPQI